MGFRLKFYNLKKRKKKKEKKDYIYDVYHKLQNIETK